MKNVVMIPCWQRPEFLFYCLQQITKAKNADQYKYLFVMDTGYSLDNQRVIERHWGYGEKFEYSTLHTPRTSYQLTKQSFSVLNGWLRSAEQTNDKVIMIEEDVLIANDFFLWHEEIHKLQPTIFAALSTANHNRKVDYGGGNWFNEYYLSHGDYCSLGVSISKKVLLELIQPHAHNNYYMRPVEYCQKHFPNSAIGKHFAEQDGLIRRIQETVPSLPTAYPMMPRAYHAGFYGKNRNKVMFHRMSLNEKIDALGEIIFSDAEMKKVALRPEYYNDSKPVSLEIMQWETLLEIKPRFT